MSEQLTTTHLIKFEIKWDFGVDPMWSSTEVEKIIKEYQELIPLVIKRNLLEKQAHAVHQQILKINQK